MPPKCTTAKPSTHKAPSESRCLSTRIAAKGMPPVTAPQAPPDDEETIDIDAELTDNEADSNHGAAVVALGQAMANSESGIPSGGPVPKKAAPSVPLELATTQGCTAYDVRYVFLTRCDHCDGSQSSDIFSNSLTKHATSASK